MQALVKAIEREEKVPTGSIDEWEEWFSDNEEVTMDLSAINEDLFSVLMDNGN